MPKPVVGSVPIDRIPPTPELAEFLKLRRLRDESERAWQVLGRTIEVIRELEREKEKAAAYSLAGHPVIYQGFRYESEADHNDAIADDRVVISRVPSLIPTNHTQRV